MSSPRVATLVAILGGILLGSLAASLSVAWESPPVAAVGNFEPPFEPLAAAPHPAVSESPPPVPSNQPAAASVASNRPAPPSQSTLEVEGPLPPWLENQLEGGEEAVTSAALSCARGNANDCMRAGDAYDSGRGVKRNERQARLNRLAGARLFEQACKKRKPEACYSLSVIYSLGLGVQRSTEVAHGHLTIASRLCRTVQAEICRRLPELDEE